jgi:flavin-dependent dehydrogenase
MAKSSSPQLDALVLGEHPASYLTAALLCHNGNVRVIHATLPDEHVVDRLVLLNPAWFTLHKLLEPVRRKLELTPVYGVQFLADDGVTRGEHRERSPVGYIASYKDVRAAVAKVAAAEGVRHLSPKRLEVLETDECGVRVAVGAETLYPRALVVAGTLDEPSRRVIGMVDGFPPEVMRRYTFMRLKGAKWAEIPAKPLMPMSLDLRGELTWGWAKYGKDEIQISVEQPLQSVSRTAPEQLLQHWATVLKQHGILRTDALPTTGMHTMNVPMAGALNHEGVANRTLLIGPAGGFYSACGEDIYPNCWSAIFAVDALRKALKERHLQDALQPYRQKWGATLGDYLRGPQQNLRFLLPLVYRNQVMTARMAEAILHGKSVIR